MANRLHPRSHWAPAAAAIDGATPLPDQQPAAPAAPDDESEASDWPLLWAACRQIQAGQGSSALDADADPAVERGGEATTRLTHGDLGVLPSRRHLRWAPRAGWVLHGPWSAGSAALFALYQPLLAPGPSAAASNDAPVTPAPAAAWVLGQLAQSLDGFVAMPSGESCYISGPPSLRHLHRLRALCDAVVVGAGTVAADDPRLTTRLVPGRHAVRVVIDPGLRLPSDRRVFHDGLAPTLCLHDARVQLEAGRHDATPGCEWLAVAGLSGDGGTVDMASVVTALRERGLQRLFFEGGGTTISNCIAQGVLDRLHLTVAPLLIGHGRRGLQMPEQRRLADCLRLRGRVCALGEDLVWDLALPRTPDAR